VEKKKDGDELNCINIWAMEGMKKKGPRGNVNNNNNIERRAKIASTTTRDFCARGHRFCSWGRCDLRQGFLLVIVITYNFGTFLKVFKRMFGHGYGY